MPMYKAPVQEMKFLMSEVLDLDKYSNLPGFSDATSDLRDAILDEGAKFAEGVVAPLNRVADMQGCRYNGEDHSVKTPDGFKNAYDTMSQNGWMGLGFPAEHGGQGLPGVLSIAVSEMVSSACMAFGMYPGLTAGAAEALLSGGTEEQIKKYVPNMVSGQWGGTMNLTEPHCGTDLGMLKSKAVPNGDGSYSITGQKIWISSGEHDLAENIVHLVLARIEGAPQGTKGISLFVVPKFHVNDDGSLGDRNDVYCGGLEEKMGIHGNATCVMNYEGAKGWLVGEENKGLKVMFIMMNRARIGTGLQGLAQAEVAYQNAAEFARDRVQGRALTGPKYPDKPADPIIVHPDVRRMLMDQKAFVEGARAFALWVALYGDLEEHAEDDEARRKAGDYMALMTPVVKAFLTGKGFDSVSQAVQVHGGMGYVEETGVAQFLRDSRISMIYEGTNGVQALDLVGRKLAMEGGRPIFTFLEELDAFAAEHDGDEAMKPFVEGVKTSKERLSQGVNWLMENGLTDFNNAGAASHDFLELFGYTALAYMWAKMAKTAMAKADSGDPFYDTKLKTGRYFVARMLPETETLLAKVKAGAEPVMALEAEAF